MTALTNRALVGTLVVLATLTGARSAHGQAQDASVVTIAPGARLRIAAPVLGPERVVTVFSDRRRDTLVLMRYYERRGDSLLIAIGDLRSIEVSRGWRSRALRLGIAGAVIGAIAGGVWGNNTYITRDPFCSLSCETEPTRLGAASGASIGLSVGGMLGVLVGRFVLGEKWVRLDPDLTPER